jgi:hypothetical protein
MAFQIVFPIVVFPIRVFSVIIKILIKDNEIIYLYFFINYSGIDDGVFKKEMEFSLKY